MGAGQPKLNMKDYLRSAIDSRLKHGIMRRSDDFIIDVFRRFANADEKLEKKDVCKAFEALSIPIRDDEFEMRFLEMDTNHDGLIDCDEFIIAAKQPTTAEVWAKCVPWWQPIADSIPVRAGTDTLRTISELSKQEVDVMCELLMLEIKRMLLDEVSRMKESYRMMDLKLAESEGKAAAKFKTFKASCGLPHIKFFDAMHAEHCIKPGSDFIFTTGNYHLTTCPRVEWGIVVNGDTCSPANMAHGRVIRKVEDCMRLELAQKAALCMEEVIALILYTGPMFEIYNAVLRRFPEHLYSVYRDGSNLFPTTIFVLVSAIQKLARVVHVREGTRLYRGLGGLMELPDYFFRPDEHGRRGYTEWGFMSTTSHKAVALQYSGVREGRPAPMVLVMWSSAIDRGACIETFSQYPQEVEYLFPPISFLQLAGEQHLECTPDGPVQMVPVRVNANLKTLTVEEICAQKQTAHLAAFDFLVDELARDLAELAEGAQAEARAATDPHAASASRFQLAARVVAQCVDVRGRHAALGAARYLDDDAYRTLVTEALAAKEMGKEKFALWLHGTEPARWLLERGLRACRREWNMLRERRLAALEGEERAALALALCRSKGLVRDGLHTPDGYGEVPLLTAAADGERDAHLELLVAARADLTARTDKGEGPVSLAARYGHAAAVRTLARLGADVGARKANGSTALHDAAYGGHCAAIEALAGLGADVDARDGGGVTPLYAAAWNGHADAVALLARLGGDVRAAAAHGGTAVYAAAFNGHAAAIELLAALGADVRAARLDGTTPAAAAAANGHAAAAAALARLGADGAPRADGAGLPGGG